MWYVNCNLKSLTINKQPFAERSVDASLVTDWITETRVLVVSIFEVATTDHLGENGFEVNQMKLFFI